MNRSSDDLASASALFADGVSLRESRFGIGCNAKGADADPLEGDEVPPLRDIVSSLLHRCVLDVVGELKACVAADDELLTGGIGAHSVGRR